MPSDFAKIISDAIVEEKLAEQMARAFVVTVRHCMEQEGVKLEAAITMTREVMERDEEIDPTLPEIQRVLTEAMDRGSNKLRSALAAARHLIRLEEEGQAEPRPYDPEMHMRARMEAIEDLRARGLL